MFGEQKMKCLRAWSADFVSVSFEILTPHFARRNHVPVWAVSMLLMLGRWVAGWRNLFPVA